MLAAKHPEEVGFVTRRREARHQILIILQIHHQDGVCGFDIGWGENPRAVGHQIDRMIGGDARHRRRRRPPLEGVKPGGERARAGQRHLGNAAIPIALRKWAATDVAVTEKQDGFEPLRKQILGRRRLVFGVQPLEPLVLLARPERAPGAAHGVGGHGQQMSDTGKRVAPPEMIIVNARVGAERHEAHHRYQLAGGAGVLVAAQDRSQMADFERQIAALDAVRIVARRRRRRPILVALDERLGKIDPGLERQRQGAP